MNTLKLLIRNLSVKLFPTSVLDNIVAQGYVEINGREAIGLPEDCELYGKEKARIMYNGRIDEIINRYSL
jgi:hypothetical protein